MSIVENWRDKPAVQHGKQRACYIPASDLIIIPSLTTFKKSEEYYSTLFHECIHGSGHEKRLDRQGITETAPFGTPCYSKEELIAEMPRSQDIFKYLPKPSPQNRAMLNKDNLHNHFYHLITNLMQT